jgi:hypothetical protein
VFTARYALSPYIKQIRFVFKGLKDSLKKETRCVACVILPPWQAPMSGSCKQNIQVPVYATINQHISTLLWVYGITGFPIEDLNTETPLARHYNYLVIFAGKETFQNLGKKSAVVTTPTTKDAKIRLLSSTMSRRPYEPLYQNTWNLAFKHSTFRCVARHNIPQDQRPSTQPQLKPKISQIRFITFSTVSAINSHESGWLNSQFRATHPHVYTDSHK